MRPPPGLTPIARAECMGNFACCGAERGVLEDVVTRVRGRLVTAGPPAREVGGSLGGSALVWHFTRTGAARLRPAVRRESWRASGREISAPLGHFTVRGLVRQGVSSAPQAGFAFAQKR